MCIFFRFRKLCESPYLESVDWARWHVFWADERVVKKDHPDSNYKLAWDGLLSKVTFTTPCSPVFQKMVYLALWCCEMEMRTPKFSLSSE
jgi:6-phosphogluconolactonase/glucosamine-6-phosphate isomerase/deaminase